jgi:hypothetical protein
MPDDQFKKLIEWFVYTICSGMILGGIINVLVVVIITAPIPQSIAPLWYTLGILIAFLIQIPHLPSR